MQAKPRKPAAQKVADATRGGKEPEPQKAKPSVWQFSKAYRDWLKKGSWSR